MGLKSFFFRDKQEQEVQIFEVYEVRWYSRYGEYSSNVEPQVKVFPNKEMAKDFKSALEAAFRLIGHTGDETKVTLKEAK